MSGKLSPLDLAFLALERGNQHAHVSGLGIIRIPKNYKGSFAHDLFEKFKKTGPATAPFTWRLHRPVVGLPSWVTAEDFKLEDHVHFSAVSDGGDHDALAELAARIHEKPLDMKLPLWECYFIEGIDGGRKIGMLTKIHHTQIDGILGIKAMNSVLADSARGKIRRAPWNALDYEADSAARREKRDDKGRGPVLKLLQRSVRTSKMVQEQVFKTIPGIGKLLLEQNYQGFVKKQKAVVPPFSSPKTIFNAKISGKRSFSYFSLPFSEVKKTAKKLDASLNELVLAMCATAAKRYLESRELLPEKSMAAGIPISIRPKDGGRSGNMISYGLINLATDITGPLERLEAIIESSKHAKASLSNLTPSGSMSFAAIMQGLTALQGQLGLVNLLPPAANLVVSNVPGPLKKKYLMGGVFEGTYPLSVLLDGAALNITLLSYDNSLDFGLLSCRKAVPDVGELSRHIQQAFEEYKQACR